MHQKPLGYFDLLSSPRPQNKRYPHIMPLCFILHATHRKAMDTSTIPVINNKTICYVAVLYDIVTYQKIYIHIFLQKTSIISCTYFRQYSLRYRHQFLHINKIVSTKMLHTKAFFSPSSTALYKRI
jgi:hypothetical protein